MSIPPERPLSPLRGLSKSYPFVMSPQRAKAAFMRLCSTPKPLPTQEIIPSRKLDLSCLEFDSKQGFVETCVTINNHLAAIVSAYPEDEIVNSEDLTHTYKQLSDKEIYISIFGRHNCGKSTLLNSVAGEMFLPVCYESETSVQVKIYHSGEVHQSGLCPKQHLDVGQASCVKCPKLVECNGDKIVNTYYGDSSIHDALQKWNNDIREKVKIIGDIPELCLYVHAPVLSGAPDGWKVCLVDNAGFGEATEHIAQLASRNMRLSSAYIYLVSADCLHDAVDSESYKTLSIQDKNCFHERRFVAVITKMDDYYTACRRPDARKRLTEEQIKNRVYDRVKEATGHDISKNEDIIPVIGQWALTAHLLIVPGKTEENKQWYLEEAIVGLKLHSRHKLSDKNDKYWASHKEEVPSALMAASGIEWLERRIKQMSKSCVRVWTEKMLGDYLDYVLKAGESLFVKYSELEDEIRRNVGRLVEATSQHDEIQGYRDELKAKMEESQSAVYDELYRAYLQDIENSSVVCHGKTKASELVEAFREETRLKIRKQSRDYGPDTFSQALEEFLEKTRGTLEGIFNIMCVFNGMQDVFTRCVVSATETYTLMRTTAGKILNKRVRLSSRSGCLNDTSVHSNIKAPNLGEVKEKVMIPQVKLSIFEKAWEWVLSIFRTKTASNDASSSDPDRSYYRSWGSEHEQAFEELTARIEEVCGSYFETIKPTTVGYFFGKYCKFNERKLRDFDSEFKIQLDEEHLQMEELKHQTDLKDMEREDLQYMCMRLEGLKVHLLESTEQYLESQGYTT